MTPRSPRRCDKTARAAEQKALTRLRTIGIDRDALALLATEGSMTRTMAERFGPVTVSLLAESIGVATMAEARSLGLHAPGGCWQREILLLADGQARLHGRTIVARDAPRLKKRLGRLGAEPLMNLLFDDGRLRPGVTRLERRFGRLRDTRLYRRTLYDIRGERLLLTETLLDVS